MKTLLLSGLLASLCLATASPARADEKAACFNAASMGQTLRDAHKLVEARDQFRICARRQCPAMVQQDCGGWLGEVQRDLPTVVVTAKDGKGSDLENVQVTMDGQPLLTTLDGQAVPMNPGEHVFHFAAADGTQVDQRAVIKAGEKNQAVAVILAKPEPVAPVSPAAGPSPGEAAVAVAPAEGASPWKTVGWVLGGIGVAGIGVGTVFGVMALGDKNAHCNADNVCDAGSLGGLRTDALVSDIGLIAGGALVVGGGAMVLFAPSASHEGGGALRIAPTWIAHGGGIAAGASW
jgi:hypothetical protein